VGAARAARLTLRSRLPTHASAARSGNVYGHRNRASRLTTTEIATGTATGWLSPSEPAPYGHGHCNLDGSQPSACTSSAGLPTVSTYVASAVRISICGLTRALSPRWRAVGLSEGSA